jgi:hypothetical protein
VSAAVLEHLWGGVPTAAGLGPVQEVGDVAVERR